MSKSLGQPWMPSPGLLFSHGNHIEPGGSPLGKSLPLETSRVQHSTLAVAVASPVALTVIDLSEPQFPCLERSSGELRQYMKMTPNSAWPWQWCQF